MVVGAVVKVVVQVEAKVEVKVEAKVEVEAGVVVSLSSVVASELTLCHLVIFCTDIIDMIQPVLLFELFAFSPPKLTPTQPLPPCLCLVPGLVCKIGTLPFPLPKFTDVMVTPTRPSAIACACRCIHLDRC